MKLYPILLILALICFGMAGYNYYQYSQTEPTQELVPCYDFHGNVISGAECIDVKDADSSVDYWAIFGIMDTVLFIIAFNKENSEQ